MSSPPESSPIVVLHVDDDPDVAAMTATWLEREREDFAVVTEHAAADGLARLDEGDVDCVVSDYKMPGTDGLEFLAAVREDRPGLPFILFTAEGSEAIASEAISAGVTDYLQKGIGIDQYAVLANRIANAVEAYRAEQRVGAQQQRFGKLVRYSTDVIFVVDPDGTFSYLTPSAERILGYRPEDLLGESGFDYIHPDDRERVIEDFYAGIEDPGITNVDEFRFEHASGSWIVLEVRGRNLLDDPDIGGVLVYARDVTDRVERERELERYETIVEASGDPVYTLDARGRFTFVNDRLAEMTGYDEDELLGEHVSIVMDEADIERGEALIRELVASGSRTRGTFEMDVVTAGGDRIPCENHLALLPVDDGFRGTTGIVRDITDRVERGRTVEQ